MAEQGNKSADAQTVPARDEKGRLLPGNTANPSGRSVIAKQMREYMEQYTKSSIDGIWEIAKDTTNEPKDRLAAYKWLAEQVVGKAPQVITGADGAPLAGNAELLADLLRKLTEK